MIKTYKDFIKESTYSPATNKFKTLEDAGKYAKDKFGTGFVAMDRDFFIVWYKNKPMMSTGRHYSVDPRKLADKPSWKSVGVLDASKYPKVDLIEV